jgi:broad specificity phosphatase PhoE
MSKTTIHLLRHGEVENPQNVIYERIPGFHLSGRGNKMAEVAAEFISKNDQLRSIKHIYSSPLERTLETAKPTAIALGNLPIITDDRLIEAQNNFAGLNVKNEVSRLFKARKFKTLWRLFHDPKAPSWGESSLEIAKRMSSVIDELREKHQNEHVLIVSHQSPIWTARLYYEGKNVQHLPNRRVCSLASITSLTFNNEADELIDVKYRTPAANIPVSCVSPVSHEPVTGVINKVEEEGQSC